jgi:hypothetical protein
MALHLNRERVLARSVELFFVILALYCGAALTLSHRLQVSKGSVASLPHSSHSLRSLLLFGLDTPFAYVDCFGLLSTLKV